MEAELAKHPPETRERLILKAIGERYKESLYATAKDLLEYSDITHYTHDATIHALEAPTKRKLICIPRGCFKSSIAVVAYSIWKLLRNPNERILIDSELYENSKNFIREIRGKLEMHRICQLFGPFHSKHWAEGSITISQRTKVLKEASITAAGVQTQKTGQHYSIVIMDDLNSSKNSETPEQRQKVLNHYKLNTSILEPDGTMVIIGTRYASLDVIGHVLENEVDPKGLLTE
jgi:hypothetical protein